MTVLTKPSLNANKYPLIEEGQLEEEIIEIPSSGARRRHVHGFGAILCMSITVFILILMGIVTAMQIYEQVNNDMMQHKHYQGFCSVPLSRDMQFMEARKLPLTWKTAPTTGRSDASVQVISLLEEDPDNVLDLLREVLDINIDDSVEKIAVYNNGHRVSFIHDFGSNETGIVDSERCFTMDMDPELVLAPELFVVGLQRGDEFDVSRVRSRLRAVLPPLAPLPPLPPLPLGALGGAELQPCTGKPTYKLVKDTNAIIRKRAADAPPHDFMQFAGKHLQEIEISNLAELLEYEQNQKQSA